MLRVSTGTNKGIGRELLTSCLEGREVLGEGVTRVGAIRKGNTCNTSAGQHCVPHRKAHQKQQTLLGTTSCSIRIAVVASEGLLSLLSSHALVPAKRQSSYRRRKSMWPWRDTWGRPRWPSWS